MRSVTGRDERTAPARIRDAAIVRFAAEGFAATTVRMVAADAGVSPALVIHHFGSKEGLRQACDAHVVAVTNAKLAALSEGGEGLAGLSALMSTGMPLLPYLARAFTEGGPAAAGLFDRLVAATEQTLQQWTADGRVHATAEPRLRAALLVSWDLAVLVFAEHIARSSGVDPREPEGLARWTTVTTDVLVHGLLRPGPWLDDLLAAVDQAVPPPRSPARDRQRETRGET